jgi:polysaccharide pyruvyl transferase WcaK-like protein
VSRGLLGRLLRLFFWRLPVEVVHWVKAFGAIRRIDVLVVPGTGIVSDYLCGPLSWPYDVFKWSVLATVCRAKLVFLSIGVGPIRHPVSAWFIRKSLGRANFRSYRDEPSRLCAQSIGVDTSRDEVRPDLAFGLTRRDYAAFGPSGAPRPPVIGLGLKDLGPSGKMGAIGYREYLDIMAAFVMWLRRNGYAVRLLIGDVQYDTQVVREFVELLRRRLTEAEMSHVVVEPALTVEDLMRQLAGTAAVVSPRFHGLLLAIELEKPVIALSDHFKLDQLLAGLGLSQYCVPLEDLDSDRLISRFRHMMSDAEQLKVSIRSGVERYRTAVEAQYAVFAKVCTGGK